MHNVDASTNPRWVKPACQPPRAVESRVVTDRPYNLAIETSSRWGGVTLGRGDERLATVRVDPERAGPRPSTTGPQPTGLMLAIDQLTRAHRVEPKDLGQVYLSIGPGSFTGLRIAVATAKSMVLALGVKLVAVPTARVVAENAPSHAGQPAGIDHLAVCLNAKDETVYAQLFDSRAGHWRTRSRPEVKSVAALLETAPRPLAVIADPTARFPDPLPPAVSMLPPSWIVARSAALWELARRRARAGRFTDPLKLLPLYARPPEAQRLWLKRHLQDTWAPPQRPTTLSQTVT